MASEDKPYVLIREYLGNFIGKRVVDITQQDEEECKANGEVYVMFHFDNGGSIKIEDKSITIRDPERTTPWPDDEEED
jgi:hypothetical protein